MNQNQAKELLPVFVAYAEGKTVQWASIAVKDWQDYTDADASHHALEPTIFLNPIFRWRVKPEAREWWVCPKCWNSHRNYELGNYACACGNAVIHVREVLT
jgi:hypothetical protein